MVITIHDADMFDFGFDVYVNPVNTQGVMGAGLAKRFLEEFPTILKPYRNACSNGSLKIGRLLPIQVDKKVVICFPTKDHWKDPSQLAFVESGLTALASLLTKHLPRSTVGIPALGCGLGGLNFNEVEHLIYHYLDPVPAQCTVFSPAKKLLGA